ncbi:MAG: undecaprenyl-phosphate glucose phosphotransferase, partial [Planctomycetota bacterium]
MTRSNSSGGAIPGTNLGSAPRGGSGSNGPERLAAVIGDRHWFEFLRPTLDAASIMASLVLVKTVARGYVDDASLAMGLIAVIVFYLVGHLSGLHRQHRGRVTDDEVISILVTWVLTVLVLALTAFATRYGQYFARSVMLGWILVCPSMIALSRMCLRIVQLALFRRGLYVRTVAIAGMNPLGMQIRQNLEDQPDLGFQFAGFYDDRCTERLQETLPGIDPDARLGDLSELVSASRSGDIETVLVTLPMRAEERIAKLLDQLSDSTVSVYIVPDFFVFDLLHSRWTQFGGLPAVSVFENPLFGIDGASKRIADLTLSVCGLFIVSVPMICIAAAVKLTSPGPVFFRQRRYGLDGQVIRVWKFRSMRVCDDGAVVRQATANDSRVTKLGSILRKTSLDELPQLFNVIEGTMSLVGPRPHASAHNEQYRNLIPGYMLRHKVKPGITGLAQVNGCRGETETIDKMKRRVEFDHQYIRSWSLWLDCRILFKTLGVAWKQPEA